MNKHVIGVVGAAILIAAALGALAGCDLGDMVRVDTPRAIQQEQGLPSSMTLNDAREEYKAWFDDTVRVGTVWRGDIERTTELVGVLRQLATAGMGEFGPVIAGVPIVGPMAPGLAIVGGYFFGTRGKGKHKEKSYNAGIAKGKEIARELGWGGTTPQAPAPQGASTAAGA